jgi:hypothetical protein
MIHFSANEPRREHASDGNAWRIPTIQDPGWVKVKADTRTRPKLKDLWTSPALQKISAPAKGHRHFLALLGVRGEPMDLADNGSRGEQGRCERLPGAYT